MTIKEAVKAFCGADIPESTIDLELINGNLDGNTNYTSSDAKNVAGVSIECLQVILTTSSIKEGDLSITYDREGIKERLLFLAKKYGFNDILKSFKPTVSDKSNLW